MASLCFVFDVLRLLCVLLCVDLLWLDGFRLVLLGVVLMVVGLVLVVVC